LNCIIIVVVVVIIIIYGCIFTYDQRVDIDLPSNLLPSL